MTREEPIGFWRLSETQEILLRHYTAHETVWDFGAGNLSLAHYLMEYGRPIPGTIYAVEKELSSTQEWIQIEGVTQVPHCFKDINPLRIDTQSVGLLSWPQNAPLHGLEALLDRCDTVVYIGKCDDTTVCGTAALWEYLQTRSVLAVIYDKHDMVVYGQPGVGTVRNGRKRLPLSGIEDGYT